MINFKSLSATAVAAALATVALSGCPSSNPDYTGKARAPLAKSDYQPIQQVKNGLSVSFDPRVDILFIIDDSASMEKHQSNLSQNIEKFVNGFAKDNVIDFHIGFTTVWDSVRYGSIVPEVCAANQTPAGRVNWLPSGTLQPMKGIEGRRYVTNADDFKTVLSKSLSPRENSILLKPLLPAVGDKDPATCPYGPESEELFRPLVDVLESPTLNAGPNLGFRRPGAFFVAILVSDAKDSSGLFEQDVYNRINAAVGERPLGGGKNFRVFSVVIKPGTRFDVANCKPDPAWVTQTSRGTNDWNKINGTIVPAQSNPLANLARLTEDGTLTVDGKADDAQILSICDKDYGDTLAKYGTQVQQDTLQDLKFELPLRADLKDASGNIVSIYDALEVYLTSPAINTPDKKIKLEAHTQWEINPSTLTITVFAKNIDWRQYPNAKILPTWIPVDETSKNAKAL